MHAIVVAWAASAWIDGPFAGDGIVDGAEFLAWARTGAPDAFGTKSPLYPLSLRFAFALAGDSPWTVAAFGLVLSLATLAALVAASRELRAPRAAPLAAWGFAISGSTIAFAVQPLEAGLAACTVAWSLVFALRAARTRTTSATIACVVFAACAVLTRAPLCVPALAVLVWLALEVRERRVVLATSVVASLGLAALLFGERAWPSGGALNLRLANGGARSGTCELRPGPSYDALRYDETFDERRALEPDRSGESLQLALLGDELAAEPVGALATLGAKALLFWHRAELVSDVDFHHGLAAFAPWPLLSQSFALVAPFACLALLCARRSRAAPLVWFVVAFFAVSVAFAAAARYRFPALPALVLLAAWFVTSDEARVSRSRRATWILALGSAVLLAIDWTGRARPIAGDGLVQEAHRLFEHDRLSPRARELCERALAIGRDPRARYDLALSYEYEHQAAARSHSPNDEPRRHAALAGGASAPGTLAPGTSVSGVRDAAPAVNALERAAELYRQALQLEPRYAEASGNWLRVLLARGEVIEAVRVGRELAERDPRAGTLRGNLALALRQLEALDEPARVAQGEIVPGEIAGEARRLEAEAHRIEALRAWAQRADELAREHARAARALGADDARLEWLLR
ncbi:MAG: glycosyltransferase family 39 protein [Planctomycetes bacterium]|nr:glycosyltransferase family 39 protein [Planctomycetota bacterium]